MNLSGHDGRTDTLTLFRWRAEIASAFNRHQADALVDGRYMNATSGQDSLSIARARSPTLLSVGTGLFLSGVGVPPAQLLMPLPRP